jgi:phenylacetate-CoA ligase
VIQGGTTGTTGEPLQIWRSPSEEALQNALLVRHRAAAGIPLRARTLAVRLSRIKEPARVVVGGRVEEIEVPASAPRVAAMLREHGPEVVVGEPSTLIEVGRVLGRHPLRGVITFGELLFPEMRAELEELYGVAPSDLYSVQEAGHVAWQCPAFRYHVNADWVIVEVLDGAGRPAPPGKTGEIVLTNLWNRTTPFLRYRVGDRGALLSGPCPCGVSLPLMAQPEGRRLDWIVGPDGREHSPFRFALGTLLGDEFFEAIRGYRLLQREPDDFLAEVEWKVGPRPDLVARIEPTFEHVLGAPARVEVVEHERLPRPLAAKLRMVESRVPRPSSG